MNMRLCVIMLVGSIVTGACAGSRTNVERPGVASGCPAANADGIVSKDDLIKAKLEIAGPLPNIAVADLRCTERAGGLRIDMDLKNESGEPRRVAYRFRWLDAQGMRAWDDEGWKPLMIYGYTLYTVTTMAPTRDAADFRVVIMDQDK